MIDLLNLQNEGVQYVGHKGYSPSTMCCFVFLDVSNDYVGRYMYILIICMYRVIFPLSYMKTTSPCLEVTQTQFLKKFYKKKNLPCLTFAVYKRSKASICFMCLCRRIPKVFP